MSLPDVLIVIGILAFVAFVTLAVRARERQIHQLLARFGQSANAVVVEYTESEDGYLLTYSFMPARASANVERTEPLATRPHVRPQPGQSVLVKYLPSLPSVSRAAIESLQ